MFAATHAIAYADGFIRDKFQRIQALTKIASKYTVPSARGRFFTHVLFPHNGPMSKGITQSQGRAISTRVRSERTVREQAYPIALRVKRPDPSAGMIWINVRTATWDLTIASAVSHPYHHGTRCRKDDSDPSRGFCAKCINRLHRF